MVKPVVEGARGSTEHAPLDPQTLGLPHRAPFVFVRELVGCVPGISAECVTWFGADDPMFAGHFPGNPLVPGVILIEALAQTAGIAAASATPDSQPMFLLSAVRSMKFLRAVRPAEKVRLFAQKAAEIGGLWQFSTTALVDAATVAEGQLILNRADNGAAGFRE